MLTVEELPLDVRQPQANPAAAFADLDLCYFYLLWVQGGNSQMELGVCELALYL